MVRKSSCISVLLCYSSEKMRKEVAKSPYAGDKGGCATWTKALELSSYLGGYPLCYEFFTHLLSPCIRLGSIRRRLIKQYQGVARTQAKHTRGHTGCRRGQHKAWTARIHRTSGMGCNTLANIDIISQSSINASSFGACIG